MIKAKAEATLYALGKTWIKAEGEKIHMVRGDAIKFMVHTELDIEVGHIGLITSDPIPNGPGLLSRLGRFYWGVRKAWRESL